MSDKTKTVTNTFPLLSILGLIFITLKLTGYIAWSWWYVLMPFYLPVVLILLLILFAALLAI